LISTVKIPGIGLFPPVRFPPTSPVPPFHDSNPCETGPGPHAAVRECLPYLPRISTPYPVVPGQAGARNPMPHGMSSRPTRRDPSAPMEFLASLEMTPPGGPRGGRGICFMPRGRPAADGTLLRTSGTTAGMAGRPGTAHEGWESWPCPGWTPRTPRNAPGRSSALSTHATRTTPHTTVHGALITGAGGCFRAGSKQRRKHEVR